VAPIRPGIAGLRQRCDITRLVAPCIGVVDERSVGHAVDFRRKEDEDINDTRLAAGIRICLQGEIDMKLHNRHIVTSSIVLGVLAIGAGIFIWSGLYNIGADDPHWTPTRMAIDILRERSIAARMADVRVPDLDDPKRIAAGAVNYSAMCTGCHLAPGVADSEIRPGLYPMPPNLSKRGSEDDKRTFWVIKHGIKMSAMPAWGKTHTDEQIWNMVAFIRKLPGMTPAQYAALGGKPPAEDTDHMHAGAGDDHDMAGMDMGQGSAAAAQGHGEGEAHDHDDVAAAVAAPSMQGFVSKAVPGAEATAQALHAALAKGDRQGALQLLAPEVVISEGGETQSRDQYAAGHLGEDIKFLAAASTKVLWIGSMAMGGKAMVGSRSEIRAIHDGKPIAVLSTERLTLKKSPNGWLITRVEWTSEPLGK
jgi:mono/diheme cytochrome c family protein